MKKLLTIAAAVGFVTIPSIAFANAGSEVSTTAKPTTAKVKHVETESEHGALVSSVASSSNNGVSESTPAPATPATTTITEAEARTIAQNTKAEATVLRSELEREHGVLVFEIKFSDGSKVYVDAATGQIISTIEQENEDEDQNEDHDNSGRGSSNSGSGNSDRR